MQSISRSVLLSLICVMSKLARIVRRLHQSSSGLLSRPTHNLYIVFRIFLQICEWLNNWIQALFEFLEDSIIEYFNFSNYSNTPIAKFCIVQIFARIPILTTIMILHVTRSPRVSYWVPRHYRVRSCPTSDRSIRTTIITLIMKTLTPPTSVHFPLASPPRECAARFSKLLYEIEKFLFRSFLIIHFSNHFSNI